MMPWKYFDSLLLPLLIIVSSTSLAGANIGVHQGDLRDVNCSAAIMSMSGDAIHKITWWQFLPFLQKSPKAFLAYMVSTNRTERCENLEREILQKGGLFASKDASLAVHHSVEEIKSLGSMEITMWVLGYICSDQPDCHFITPVILKQTPHEKQAFFTVWEVVKINSQFENSVTANLLDMEYASHDLNEVTFRIIPEKYDLPFCTGEYKSTQNSTSYIELAGENDAEKLNFVGIPAPEAAGFTLPNKCPVHRQTQGRCIMGIENLDGNNSGILRGTTTDLEILRSYMLQVRGSYIQAQNSALTLEKGQPTDFMVAAIAIPSSWIAVIAAIRPLTNSQLKILRRVRTLRRLSHNWKTFVLCLCNCLLAVASYSAVIALIPAELQRQKSFETWGLLADEVPITLRGLQVLVVVYAKSRYKSSSLFLVWLSTAGMLQVTGVMTFYRCKQVFQRWKLLRDLREASPIASSKIDDEGGEDLDELEAIDMTSREYLRLTKKYQMVKDSKVGGLTSLAYDRKTVTLLKRVFSLPRGI